MTTNAHIITPDNSLRLAAAAHTRRMQQVGNISDFSLGDHLWRIATFLGHRVNMTSVGVILWNETAFPFYAQNDLKQIGLDFAKVVFRLAQEAHPGL